MPVELTKLEDFIEVAKRAVECRVKRNKGGVVKIKARTKRYLYTYKVKLDESKLEDELKSLLEKIPCRKIVDIDKGETIKESS
jgi:large subunit ribosomal protein L38e